jgi:hypothetical protein
MVMNLPIQVLDGKDIIAVSALKLFNGDIINIKNVF